MYKGMGYKTFIFLRAYFEVLLKFGETGLKQQQNVQNMPEKNCIIVHIKRCI